MRANTSRGLWLKEEVWTAPEKQILMLSFRPTHWIFDVIVVIWCLRDFHGSLERPRTSMILEKRNNKNKTEKVFQFIMLINLRRPTLAINMVTAPTENNLVLSTGLILRIGHSKEIRKLTFRALALCQAERIQIFQTFQLPNLFI